MDIHCAVGESWLVLNCEVRKKGEFQQARSNLQAQFKVVRWNPQDRKHSVRNRKSILIYAQPWSRYAIQEQQLESQTCLNLSNANHAVLCRNLIGRLLYHTPLHSIKHSFLISVCFGKAVPSAMLINSIAKATQMLCTSESW